MVTKESWLLFAFSFVAFLVTRLVWELLVWDSFPKKTYKKYKKETKFWNRYFIISARKLIKDRYLKSENRVIRYSTLIQFYFWLNIIMQSAFLTVIASLILLQFSFLNNTIFSIVCISFLSITLVFFAIFALIENYIDRNYHRKREHRKY